MRETIGGSRSLPVGWEYSSPHCRCRSDWC